MACKTAQLAWALILFSSVSGAALQCLPAPAGFPEVDRAYQTGLSSAPNEAADEARIELGQRLFTDPRLSISGQVSCASCHNPESAFADQRARSVGALGDTLAVNTPSLHNVALKYRMHWQAGGPVKLAQQHTTVLTSTDPVEMGFQSSQLAPLNAEPELLALLRTAHLPLDNTSPSEPKQALDQSAVASLLARYVSTLVCATAFDQFLFSGRTTALTAQQRDGLQLFSSPPRNCHQCHQGPLLGGGLRSKGSAFPAPEHRRKLHDQTVTLNVPSLRQVSHTAPYFADGRAKSLVEVLEHYANGNFADVPGFAMTVQEQQALLAFLASL